MSDQPPTTGFGFQPHPVVTVNVDTLVETVREGIPDDYLGPDPNDPMAGEKWGPNPAVLAALSDLAARARERDDALGAMGAADDAVEAALRDADAALAWITENHPKVMRELPTALYQGLRRAALADDGDGA